MFASDGVNNSVVPDLDFASRYIIALLVDVGREKLVILVDGLYRAGWRDVVGVHARHERVKNIHPGPRDLLGLICWVKVN